MTFVSLNPELMLALINNLNDRVSCVKEERKVIHNSSADNSDAAEGPPVQSVDDLSSILSTTDGATVTLYGAATSLSDVAADLKLRRDEVVNLNSNGVTTRNPDGTLSYYLPTPAEGVDPASVDTIENVRAYNSQSVENAKAQAAELQEAVNSENGTSSKGRSVEEILAQMRKHEDIPTYGASFVNAVGGGGMYVNLMKSIDERFTQKPETIEAAVEVLGHVLGGASQSEVGGDDLAIEVATLTTTQPSTDTVSIINALIDQEGAFYGTTFLVNAATMLEKVDPERLTTGNTYISLTRSRDPLAGVLHGMSRNPEAALKYLGGNGEVDSEGNWVPDKTTMARWEMLKNRDWDINPPTRHTENKGIEGFTAALAAVSAYRNPDLNDVEARPGADAAATYAAGMGVDHFSGDSWSKNDFSEQMKRNMAVVLANSPEEVSTAAAGSNLKETAKGPSLKKWGVNENDISTLIYRFGDSPSAMVTLSAGLGDYHHDLLEQRTLAADNPQSELRNQVRQRSTTLAYIEDLSEQRYDDNVAESIMEEAEARRQNTEAVNTALSAFNAAVTAGIAAVTDGTAAPLAYELGSTITQPLAADFVANYLEVPPVDAEHLSDSHYSRLRAQAFADAIEMELREAGDQGIILEQDIETLRNKEWFTSNPEDGQPHVNPSKMTKEQIESIITWRDHEAGSNDFLNDLEDAIATGSTTADERLDDIPPNRK